MVAETHLKTTLRLEEPSTALDLERIAELDVSAASGLVVLADRLFVVADDERFLASYDLEGRPLGRTPLWPGALPGEHAARKREKPDLEALTRLPDGRLLALGSGSTDRRRAGALFDIDSGVVALVDFAPLYDQLAAVIPELNIEGAAVFDERIWLAHRGNGRSRKNACVELSLHAIESWLSGASGLAPDALRAIHAVELPQLHGVPLTLTDLTALPECGLLFCAAAEASADTYEDGACTGSAIGLLDRDAQLVRLASVTESCKLEGISAVRSGDCVELWLVADPDDRARRAPLFHVRDVGPWLR